MCDTHRRPPANEAICGVISLQEDNQTGVLALGLGQPPSPTAAVTLEGGTHGAPRARALLAPAMTRSPSLQKDHYKVLLSTVWNAREIYLVLGSPPAWISCSLGVLPDRFSAHLASGRARASGTSVGDHAKTPDVLHDTMTETRSRWEILPGGVHIGSWYVRVPLPLMSVPVAMELSPSLLAQLRHPYLCDSTAAKLGQPSAVAALLAAEDAAEREHG